MKANYILLLSTGLFFTLKSIAQVRENHSFMLIGKTIDASLDSVSVQYINVQGKIIQQTVPASNGSFTISGLIDQPTFSFLLFKHKGELIGRRDVELKRNVAYLTPGEMTISKVPEANGYVQIQGSKTQEEWKELRDRTLPLERTIDSISKASPAQAHGEATTEKEDKLGIKILPYKLKLASINYDYFIHHGDSYVTADRVKYYTSVFSLDSIKALYHNYTDEIKASTDGKRLAAEIKSREVGLPGAVAYAFQVKDKDDKDLSLGSFKGKYVLLDFWATWCVPCRASMPHMINLYKKYKDKNFVMIGVGDDDKNVKNWLAAIEKDGTGLWPQVLRGLNREMYLKGIDNPRDIGQQYGIRALPTKILVGPDGVIIGRFDGQHGSDEDMEKILREKL
ncbi:hypothetical protein DBR11_12665 [Pedobacter sp. HMWF019]|uniref:TlpA disulfide reductase family protein n=1 Tax=Pedobacter sp. HMWF019 TaxID=2056856 RepID=UPI000D3DA22F|nr:TlpA disulfide reductase family protein [Pedobacter sp. HMWF019]PTS99305.1 hypothetical protein DBR11_12665 [Pedobacter sp. HMWF019]